MKRWITILLVIILSFGTLSITASAENEKTPVVYFDAGNTLWKDFDQIYCHIWEYNGDSFFEWQSKREKCDKVNNDGLWRYSLEAYGVDLEDGKMYGIMFSSSDDCETYPLFFDRSCYGDTVCVTEETEAPYSPANTNTVYTACWTRSDPEVYGPMLLITDDGRVTGSVCPPDRTPADLLKSVLSSHFELEMIRSSTGMSDQEIVDQLRIGLSLEDFEVEKVLREIKEPIEWLPRWELPVPEPNGKASDLLKEQIKDSSYNLTVRVYIEYADEIRIAPPDSDDPHATDQYHTELEKRERRIFDKIFRGTYVTIYVCGMSDGVIAEVETFDVAQIAENDLVKSIDLAYNYENPKLRGYVGPGCRFARQFEKQFGKSALENSCAKYDEVRYHYDENGAIDWAIVNYIPFVQAGSDVGVRYVFCDKAIYLPQSYSPFAYGYGLYDVKKDTFTDLRYAYLFDEYEGLEEAYRSLDLSYLSSQPSSISSDRRLRGDADGDGIVTVLDATRIQKCKANLISRYELMTQNADADRDGIITILDATRIQKYKANLCDWNGKSC